MFSTFKSRLRKWAELTHEDFFRLLGWSPSKVDFDTRTVVASASRDGETLVYLTAEPVYVVGCYALKPEATEAELHKCGDAIDAELAVEAQRVGISKFWIELPNGVPPQPGEKTIRVVERSIPDAQQNQQLSVPELRSTESPTVWLN